MRRPALHFFCVPVAIAFLAPAACALPSDSQNGGPPGRHFVDFLAGNTLKVLFDAGLRPTRVGGLESLTCEIGRSDLAVRLPNGNQFDIDAERASFDVLADNELSSARIFGVDKQVPEAAARVKAIAAAIEISDEGLDETIMNLGTRIDPNKRWHRARRINDLTVGVTFYPMFYRSGVKARVRVQLIWNRPLGSFRFLAEPIQPPPGYEHISMDPTPFPTVPRSASDAIATPTPRGSPTLTPDAATSPTSAAPSAHGSSTPSPQLASPTSTLSSSNATVPRWQWILSIGIAICAIAFAYFLWRRSRSTTR